MSQDPRQKIDALRIKKGWTRAKLAHEIGLSVTSVYNWYNEKNSMPTIPVLESICLLFEISMAELFTDIEFDTLTPKEITLLESFRKLNETQQNCIVEITKNAASL